MNILNVIRLTALLLPVSAYANSTLMSVYHAAEQSDQQFLSERAAFDATQYNRASATSRFGPSLTLSHSETGVDSGYTSYGEYHQETSTIQLKQPVLHREHWSQWQSANASQKLGQAQWKMAQQNLVYRVATLYFNVLKAQDYHVFAQAQKTAFERQLAQIKQRFDVGLVPMTDVLEAQSRYDISLATDIDAQNQLANAYENLYEITGQDMAPLQTLGDDNAGLKMPHTDHESVWADAALQQNWGIAAQANIMRKSWHDFKTAQAGFWPYVDFEANYRYANATTASSNKVETKSIMLTAVWPIFSSGQTWFSTQTAYKQYHQQKYLLRSEKRQVNAATRQHYRTVMADKSIIQARHQALLSSQEALEATEAAYHLGTRTIVDVLDAQTQWLNAKKDRALAYYDLALDILKLKELTGTLDLEDLRALDQWLEDSHRD